MPNPTNRFDWTTEHKRLLPIQSCPPPTTFAHKLETGVTNGDCLPACFAALLECMHRGKITSSSLDVAASNMRTQIVHWVKTNWERCTPFQSSIPVHELMWLQHDLGASPEERAQAEEWGESPESRFQAYSKVCDDIYFSDTEMMVFASMMLERRPLIPILFRVWRVTGHRQDVGELIQTVPSQDFYTQHAVHEAIIIDLAHVGRVDGASAHYKLLSSASIEGLTKCHPHTSKRKREA